MQPLYRLLLLIFVVILPFNIVLAQDDMNDLLEPLVPPEINYDDLLEPLVSPESDYDDLLEPLVTTNPYEDLLEPLVTATASQPTRTPDPRIQMPTDGMYYKRSGSSMEITGQCRRTRFDCNGCGGGSYMEDSELPQVPICGIAKGSQPAISVEDRPYLYIPPTTNRFGESQTSYMQELDANGQTVGSFRIETRTDVIVISPTEVHHVVTMIQEGGCTQTYTTIYTLASAGGVMCTTQSFPTSTPMLSTPTPVVESTPMPEDEPIIEAPATPIKLTLYVTPDEYIDEKCNADNNFPSLETVDVSFNDDYTVTVDAAGQVYTLYRDGQNNFGYDSGGMMANSYSLSIYTILEGSKWSFTWRGADSQRNNCWNSMKLTIEKPIPVTPTPVPVSTPVGAAIEPQTVSGTYNASWLTGYMPACDAIFDGMVPDNTTLDVEFSEGVAVLDLGDGSLTLTADQDWYANYAPAVDGIQVAVMLFANSNDDGWLLSWTATSDDKVCLTSATLTLP